MGAAGGDVGVSLDVEAVGVFGLLSLGVEWGVVLESRGGVWVEFWSISCLMSAMCTIKGRKQLGSYHQAGWRKDLEG